MKQKDLALLGGILVLSVIISLVLSSLIFGSSKDRQQKVEVVDSISAEFPIDEVSCNNDQDQTAAKKKPCDKQFNNQAVNPAQLIQIGQPNEHPFAGAPS